MRICLVLEGCYPYVHGGVSTWMHQYITVMKEHEFVLWVIGAHACDRGKFVYELPDNVVEVHEVFLDDALKLKEHGNQKGQLHRINRFSEEETKSLRELMECSHPDWEVLFHLYHDRKMNPMSFLKSEQFLNILTESCLEKYPYIAFADAFHTMRSMLLISSGFRGSSGRYLSCHFNRIWGTSCLPWRICLQETGITYRAWDIHKRKRGRDHQGKMGNPII